MRISHLRSSQALRLYRHPKSYHSSSPHGSSLAACRSVAHHRSIAGFPAATTTVSSEFCLTKATPQWRYSGVAMEDWEVGVVQNLQEQGGQELAR